MAKNKIIDQLKKQLKKEYKTYKRAMKWVSKTSKKINDLHIEIENEEIINKINSIRINAERTIKEVGKTESEKNLLNLNSTEIGINDKLEKKIGKIKSLEYSRKAHSKDNKISKLNECNTLNNYDNFHELETSKKLEEEKYLKKLDSTANAKNNKMVEVKKDKKVLDEKINWKRLEIYSSEQMNKLQYYFEIKDEYIHSNVDNVLYITDSNVEYKRNFNYKITDRAKFKWSQLNKNKMKILVTDELVNRIVELIRIKVEETNESDSKNSVLTINDYEQNSSDTKPTSYMHPKVKRKKN